MTQTFQEFSQSEFAGHTAEELAGLEIDLLRRWCRLATGIMLYLRNAIPSIRFRMPANGIVVEHAKNLHHRVSPQTSKAPLTEPISTDRGQSMILASVVIGQCHLSNF